MPRADGQSLLNLSIALESNPGVYALLLGSGVSRSAQIPTGWEIVLDLISRVAAAEGEATPEDPEAWYRGKFGERPEYDKVVQRLAGTRAERRGLLRKYFEPTDDERDQGLKLPTTAHRAVARLAKLGYVRLILTTNFDRLTETALTDEGLAPDVIRTADDLKGAFPLIHSSCTVVKLHGDYLDTRIRNIPRELNKYPKNLNSFLDRVLDEFGLIVCGWSGEWDHALADAILRCPTRRFGMYWLARGEPDEAAKTITQQRRAEVVRIDHADQAFNELLERVESLRELDKPHPLSVGAAVEAVKRYLPDASNRIRLHDLVMDEVASVYERSGPAHFPVRVSRFEIEDVHGRIRRYEAIVERLVAMMAALGYHDDGRNGSLTTRTISRLTQYPMGNGISGLLSLQMYPALLVLYASGVSALAARRYLNLAASINSPLVSSEYEADSHPALKDVNAVSVLHDVVPRPNATREYTPGSNHLHDLLREPLRRYIPGDSEYDSVFDIFEYFLAVTYADLLGDDSGPARWVPIGRYGWRRHGRAVGKQFVADGLAQGHEWDVLKSGFFGGSLSRARTAFDAHEQHLQEVARGWP